MRSKFTRRFRTYCLLALPGAMLNQQTFSQSLSQPESLAPLPAAPAQLPEVLVRASRESVPMPEAALLNADTLVPEPSAEVRAQDGAALLEAVPGAAVIRNGPQTGIVQLHGLGGDRVNVAVNGMQISPACPNHMDPPLHYAAPAAIASITVLAGITPVSLGGDSIGGTVLVDSAMPRFSEDEHWLPSGTIGTFYRSSNDGFGFNAESGIANRSAGLLYSGSWQTAGDLRFPGGRVRDTGFETQEHTIVGAKRTVRGFWSIDARITRTSEAGTPALPMDMIDDDAFGLGIKHLGDYDFGTIELRGYYHSIEHLMDNYSLRPVAPGAMRMRSPASSDDAGLALGASMPRGNHTIRMGLGFHLNQLDAYQQNAVTRAKQDTLNDAMRTRAWTYAELQSEWSDRWLTSIGVRNDTVLSDSADIRQSFPASAADRDAFNGRGHAFVDPNFDVTASLRFTPGPSSAYEFAFARKNRAPNLIERYLWTPLSASAGMADGRSYLGNLDLDSETSHQFAATAEWNVRRFSLKTTPFYNLVSDYIQAAPTTRLDQSGRPVLQFQNLGRADLFGVDGSAGYQLTTNLFLHAMISYVQGINRDTGGALYRIAPLRGALRLEHRAGPWKNTAELVMADAQNRVAAYNSETRTPAYAVLNLGTRVQLWQYWNFQLGVENVFNRKYSEHLGGINRVSGSDVPVGSRIPEPGRFLYAAANFIF